MKMGLTAPPKSSIGATRPKIKNKREAKAVLGQRSK